MRRREDSDWRHNFCSDIIWHGRHCLFRIRCSPQYTHIHAHRHTGNGLRATRSSSDNGGCNLYTENHYYYYYFRKGFESDPFLAGTPKLWLTWNVPGISATNCRVRQQAHYLQKKWIPFTVAAHLERVCVRASRTLPGDRGNVWGENFGEFVINYTARLVRYNSTSLSRNAGKRDRWISRINRSHWTCANNCDAHHKCNIAIETIHLCCVSLVVTIARRPTNALALFAVVLIWERVHAIPTTFSEPKRARAAISWTFCRQQVSGKFVRHEKVSNGWREHLRAWHIYYFNSVISLYSMHFVMQRKAPFCSWLGAAECRVPFTRCDSQPFRAFYESLAAHTHTSPLLISSRN